MSERELQPGDVVLGDFEEGYDWRNTRLVVEQRVEGTESYAVYALDPRPDREWIMSAKIVNEDPQRLVMVWPARHLKLLKAGPGAFSPDMLPWNQ